MFSNKQPDSSERGRRENIDGLILGIQQNNTQTEHNPEQKAQQFTRTQEIQQKVIDENDEY